MTCTCSHRIDDLEMRLSHQDRTIEDLNRAVTEQWRVIDGLTRKLQLLEEHIRSSGGLIADPGSEPPPPHY